jgi:hypothetical protein
MECPNDYVCNHYEIGQIHVRTKSFFDILEDLSPEPPTRNPQFNMPSTSTGKRKYNYFKIYSSDSDSSDDGIPLRVMLHGRFSRSGNPLLNRTRLNYIWTLYATNYTVRFPAAVCRREKFDRCMQRQTAAVNRHFKTTRAVIRYCVILRGTFSLARRLCASVARGASKCSTRIVLLLKYKKDLLYMM